MDTLTKLIQQAARKPGVGEVRICYFDTSPPAFHARAMPDNEAAHGMVMQEMQDTRNPALAVTEYVHALERHKVCQLHHGSGATPEAAVRALLVAMSVAAAPVPRQAPALADARYPRAFEMVGKA